MASKVLDWLASLPDSALCRDPEEIDSVHSEDDIEHDSDDYDAVNEAPYIDPKAPRSVTSEDDTEYGSDVYNDVDESPFTDPKDPDSVSSESDNDYDSKVPSVIKKSAKRPALCHLNMVCKKRRLWQPSQGDQLPGRNRGDMDSAPSEDGCEYEETSKGNGFSTAALSGYAADISHLNESDTDSDISGNDDPPAELEEPLNDDREVDIVTGQDAAGDGVHSVDLRGQLDSDMGPGRDANVPSMDPSMDLSIDPSMHPSMDIQMPFNGTQLDLLAFVAAKMGY